MACNRPWNYAFMGKEAKARVDAAWAKCKAAEADAKARVAEATGTRSGDAWLDAGMDIAGALLSGAGAYSGGDPRDPATIAAMLGAAGDSLSGDAPTLPASATAPAAPFDPMTWVSMNPIPSLAILAIATKAMKVW